MKQWDVWSECGINTEMAPKDEERASGLEQAHKKDTKTNDTYSDKTHYGVIRGYGMSMVTARSGEIHSRKPTAGQTQAELVAEDVKSKAKETVSGFEAQRKCTFIGTKPDPRSFRVLGEKGIMVRTGRRARAGITLYRHGR